MKKCLPAILITLCLASLSWAGCSSSSPHEGMIRYNGEWITVEEYEQIKWNEEVGEAEPLPPDVEINIPPVNIDIPPLAPPESEPEEEEWLYDSIVYKITGTADSVFVTLSNDSGGTEQYDNVSVPHEYEYEEFDYWFAYISAQNLGESGSVTVSIYLNGRKVKTSTSSGAYVIADASLSLY